MQALVGQHLAGDVVHPARPRLPQSNTRLRAPPPTHASILSPAPCPSPSPRTAYILTWSLTAPFVTPELRDGTCYLPRCAECGIRSVEHPPVHCPTGLRTLVRMCEKEILEACARGVRCSVEGRESVFCVDFVVEGREFAGSGKGRCVEESTEEKLDVTACKDSRYRRQSTAAGEEKPASARAKLRYAFVTTHRIPREQYFAARAQVQTRTGVYKGSIEQDALRVYEHWLHNSRAKLLLVALRDHETGEAYLFAIQYREEAWGRWVPW